MVNLRMHVEEFGEKDLRGYSLGYDEDSAEIFQLALRQSRSTSCYRAAAW